MKKLMDCMHVDDILNHFFQLQEMVPEGKRCIWIMDMKNYMFLQRFKDADAQYINQKFENDPLAPSFGRLLGCPIAINESITDPIVAAI